MELFSTFLIVIPW